MSAPGLAPREEPRDDEPPHDALLSVSEAAAYYQINPSTLREWAREDRVVHLRASTGQRAAIFFRRQDLEQDVDW